MAAKQLVFSEDARRKLSNGMNVVANAVGATLGPKGRNVAVDRKFGSPMITHDGVSVAKEIELEDQFENMGAQLLKEAATKTNDIAGDGTTTATVLAQAIVKEGLKNVEAGANPMLLKRGIEVATEAVSKFIRDSATPIETREEIAKVASTSAQSTCAAREKVTSWRAKLSFRRAAGGVGSGAARFSHTVADGNAAASGSSGGALGAAGA